MKLRAYVALVWLFLILFSNPVFSDEENSEDTVVSTAATSDSETQSTTEAEKEKPTAVEEKKQEEEKPAAVEEKKQEEEKPAVVATEFDANLCDDEGSYEPEKCKAHSEKLSKELEKKQEEEKPAAVATEFDANLCDDEGSYEPEKCAAQAEKNSAEFKKKIDEAAKPKTLDEARQRHQNAEAAAAKKDEEATQAHAQVEETYKAQAKIDEEINKNIAEHEKRIKEDPNADVSDLVKKREELDKKHAELSDKRKKHDDELDLKSKEQAKAAKEKEEAESHVAKKTEEHNAKVQEEARLEAQAKIEKLKAEEEERKKQEAAAAAAAARRREIARRQEQARQQAAAKKAAEAREDAAQNDREIRRALAVAPAPTAKPVAPKPSPPVQEQSFFQRAKSAASDVVNYGPGFVKDVVTGGESGKAIAERTGNVIVGGTVGVVDGAVQYVKDAKPKPGALSRATETVAGAVSDAVNYGPGFVKDVFTGGDSGKQVASTFVSGATTVANGVQKGARAVVNDPTGSLAAVGRTVFVDPVAHGYDAARTLADGCYGKECTDASVKFAASVAETGMNATGIGALGKAAVRRATGTSTAEVIRDGKVIAETTYREVATAEQATSRPVSALQASTTTAAETRSSSSLASKASAKADDIDDAVIISETTNSSRAATSTARPQLPAPKPNATSTAAESVVVEEGITEVAAATTRAPASVRAANDAQFIQQEVRQVANGAPVVQSSSGVVSEVIDVGAGSVRSNVVNIAERASVATTPVATPVVRTTAAVEERLAASEARLAEARTGDFNLGGLSQAERRVLDAEAKVAAEGTSAAKAELEAAQSGLRNQAQESVVRAERAAAAPKPVTTPTAAPARAPASRVASAEEIAAASEARLAQARTNPEYNLGALTKKEQDILAAEQRAEAGQTTVKSTTTKATEVSAAEAREVARKQAAEEAHQSTLKRIEQNQDHRQRLLDSDADHVAAQRRIAREADDKVRVARDEEFNARFDDRYAHPDQWAKSNDRVRAAAQNLELEENYAASSAKALAEAEGQYADRIAQHVAHTKGEKIEGLVSAAQTETGGLRKISQAQKDEILQVSGNLTESERVIAAEKLAGRSLSEAEREAVIEAHNIGAAEGRRFGTYTPAQLREKTETLIEAGFSKQEASTLLRSGVTGQAAPLRGITAVDGRVEALKASTKIGEQVGSQTARIEGEKGFGKLIEAVETGRGSVGEALEAQEKASRLFYTGKVDPSYVSRIGGEARFTAEGVQMGGIKASEVVSKAGGDIKKLESAAEALESTAAEVQSVIKPELNLKYYRLKEAQLEVRRAIADKKHGGDYLSRAPDSVIDEIQALESELESIRKKLTPKIRTAIGN